MQDMNKVGLNSNIHFGTYKACDPVEIIEAFLSAFETGLGILSSLDTFPAGSAVIADGSAAVSLENIATNDIICNA